MPRTEHHEHPALDMGGGKDVEEKRAKREIANMNERRRMQNINTGFHSLRALLPNRHDGEKLSKAAILSHTAQFIYQMEQEMSKLISQNSELKRLVGGGGSAVPAVNAPEWIKRLATQPPDCPSCKRRKFEDNNRNMDLSGDGSSTESSSEQEATAKFRARKQNGKASEQALRKQLARLEKQLEDERRVRSMLEEELNYHSKALSQNGRQVYNPAIDPAAMIEEVEIASEAIEIEMHSCPASPPEMLHMDQSTSNSVFQLENHPHHHSTGISSPLELAHAKLIEQRMQANKNVIAIPNDVPFVAPHEVKVEPFDPELDKSSADGNSSPSVMVLVDNSGNLLHFLDPLKIQSTSSAIITTSTPSVVVSPTTKLMQLVSSPSSESVKIESSPAMSPKNLSNIITTTPSILGSIMSVGESLKQEENSPEGAKTSRQNLNTIVEAIRHLEGDHLFNERSVTRESVIATVIDSRFVPMTMK